MDELSTITNKYLEIEKQKAPSFKEILSITGRKDHIEESFKSNFLDDDLENIRSIIYLIKNKFEDISLQIRPSFEELDSWKTTNHSKLDESQQIYSDYLELQKYLKTLKNAITSFSNAPKPIRNPAGANTLIRTIAMYITSINTVMETDGFDVENGNEAKVFKTMQNAYFEFIALAKEFFEKVRQEGFQPPDITDNYGTKL